MLSRIVRWLDLTIFLGFVAWAFVTVPRTASWWLGMAIVAACTPFWVLARIQLGTSFSVDARANHLVTTGLYSKLRHPVYVFGTAAVLGLLIAMLGSNAAVIAVILIPVQILRAFREERVLAAAFGASYEAYRQSSWF